MWVPGVCASGIFFVSPGVTFARSGQEGDDVYAVRSWTVVWVRRATGRCCPVWYRVNLRGS